jgi:hypothetical protein
MCLSCGHRERHKTRRKNERDIEIERHLLGRLGLGEAVDEEVNIGAQHVRFVEVRVQAG